jgi:transketolase
MSNSNVKSMRDAFFEHIYTLAKQDKDIVIVSADMAAPALDIFRRDFKDRFINVGISEQNAILVAAGLALIGKKPIAYAITQFISLRAFEQIRVYSCGMNLPMSIVGFGAGTGYYESGPTHHIIEDISVMRTLPYLKIYNASDQESAMAFADFAIDGKGPKYIRLDRDKIGGLHNPGEKYLSGVSVIAPLCEINIISTGNMVKMALDVKGKLHEEGINIGVVDLYRFPADNASLLDVLSSSRVLVTLEEHTLAGGLGGYLLEVMNDNGIAPPLKRLGMDTSRGYAGCYNYGGREAIRGEFGIDYETIVNSMEMILGECKVNDVYWVSTN